MGILDQDPYRQVAVDVFAAMDAAEAQTGLRVSPFAREILTDLLVAPTFEVGSPRTEPSRQGSALTNEFVARIDSILADIAEVYGVQSRSGQRLGVIDTADLYHWLAERSEGVVSQFDCPYDK